MTKEQWALLYSSQGIYIVPITDPNGYPADDTAGKRPLLTDWANKASKSANVVSGWYKQHEERNIGILTGPKSGLLCLDIDPRNGGDLWRQEHLAELDASGAVVEITGADGWHYWFACPQDPTISSWRPAPGVEVFASSKHQVVVTPSIHPKTKKAYRFEGRDLPTVMVEGLVIPPQWLLDTRKKDGEGVGGGCGANSDSRTVSSSLPTLTTQAALVLEDALKNLNAEAGRHNSLGSWVMDATAAGADRDWIYERAEPWMQSKGRELQRGEVENWIKEAHSRMENKTLIVTTPGARPDLDFQVVETKNDSHVQIPTTYNWTADLDQTKDGKIKGSLKNITLALIHADVLKGVIGLNIFTQSLALRRSPPWDANRVIPPDGLEWTDADTIACSVFLATQYGMDVATSKCYEGVVHAAQSNPYHPVIEYLDSLRWDGVERLNTWMTHYLGAEGQPLYLREVGRCWMISAVARVRMPGCKADHMAIFEGLGGIGKSTFLNILGGRWFTDSLGDLSAGNLKDVIDCMRGNWIIELSELDSIRRAEAGRVKSFISRKVDRARLAYERCTKDFPRQCIFAGTTNLTEYLRDETGARRFWPVELKGLIKLDQIARDRDQLWAEALHLFLSGEQWHITDPEVLAMAEETREIRYDGDEWEHPVLEYLEKRQKTTGLDVWHGGLNGKTENFDRTSQLRISAILRKAGWKKKPYREGTRLVKGYIKS